MYDLSTWPVVSYKNGVTEIANDATVAEEWKSEGLQHCLLSCYVLPTECLEQARRS